jgi:hypothetical protein
MAAPIFKIKNQNFLIMDKKTFNLNHDCDGNIAEMLGLTPGFDDFVIKEMKKSAIDKDTWTEAFEDTLNKALPKTMLEAFYIGWVAAKMYEKAQQKQGQESLMALLRGMQE